jgi:hypothetical protein
MHGSPASEAELLGPRQAERPKQAHRFGVEAGFVQAAGAAGAEALSAMGRVVTCDMLHGIIITRRSFRTTK